MGMRVRRTTNNIPKLKRAMQKLGRNSIKVGIFGADNYKYGDDADLVTIARVHEYGANITPKTAQWLTIPLIPEAKNKRAGEFDLYFNQPMGKEHAFLSRNISGRKQNVFLLVKSIHIPERSFIRSGFDANVNEITRKIERYMDEVLDFNINVDVFLDMVGLEFAGMIQRHMRSITTPPNSAITTKVKRSSNPLMDSGRLVGAVRHEVE